MAGTDFSKILSDLKEWGFNDYELERLTGIKRSSLTKLRTGARKQPNYDDGTAIMGLYRRQVRKHASKGTTHRKHESSQVE